MEEISVRDWDAYFLIRELFDLIVVVDADVLLIRSDDGGETNRYSFSFSSSSS